MKREICLAIPALLLLTACGASKPQTPDPEKSASKDELTRLCEAVGAKQVADMETTVELGVEQAKRADRYTSEAKKARKLMDRFINDFDKRQARTCCRELRENVSGFSRDQRTYAYNSILLSRFNLTPNQSEAAIEYRDAARGDLTMDQALPATSINSKLGQCFSRVERELDEEYREKYPEMRR